MIRAIGPRLLLLLLIIPQYSLNVTIDSIRFLPQLAHMLAKNESPESISSFLEKQHSDKNTQDFHGLNALLVSAYYGSAPIIDYLFQKGVFSFAVDKEGKDALMMVAGSRQAADTQASVNALKTILAKNNQDNNARSLFLASRIGHPNKVAALLRHVTTYDLLNIQDILSRIHALQSTYTKIAHRIIETVNNPKKFTLQETGLEMPPYSQKTEYALESLGDVYEDIISSRIFTTATKSRLQSLDSLNTQDLWGYSPLMIATRGKNREAFEYLIAKKTEWRLRTFFNDTALSLAAGNDFYQGLHLGDMDNNQKQSDLDKHNCAGLTIAEIATQKASLYLVRRMHESVIPINENGDPFARALFAGLRAGFYDIVDYLLIHGYYTVKQLEEAHHFVLDRQEKYTAIEQLLTVKLRQIKSLTT